MRFRARYGGVLGAVRSVFRLDTRRRFRRWLSGVRRSALGVRRSVFVVRRSLSGAGHPTLGVRGDGSCRSGVASGRSGRGRVGGGVWAAARRGAGRCGAGRRGAGRAVRCGACDTVRGGAGRAKKKRPERRVVPVRSVVWSVGGVVGRVGVSLVGASSRDVGGGVGVGEGVGVVTRGGAF